MSKTSARSQIRHLPPVMMLVGSVLLLYAGVQYAHMCLEQRSLAHEWRQQQAATNAPTNARSPAGLTRLSIPSIHLDAIVVEGTTRHDLLLGPGHIKSTVEPGQPGNAVITGHRDTFFRHIHELNRGDVITLQREGKTYRYEVTAKRIVDAADISVIQPSKDTRLTLITCYPTYYVGPAPGRLVISAKSTGDTQDSPIVRTAQISQGETARTPKQ